jgi:hypothetical protein
MMMSKRQFSQSSCLLGLDLALNPHCPCLFLVFVLLDDQLPHSLYMINRSICRTSADRTCVCSYPTIITHLAIMWSRIPP